MASPPTCCWRAESENGELAILSGERACGSGDMVYSVQKSDVPFDTTDLVVFFDDAGRDFASFRVQESRSCTKSPTLAPQVTPTPPRPPT